MNFKIYAIFIFFIQFSQLYLIVQCQCHHYFEYYYNETNQEIMASIKIQPPMQFISLHLKVQLNIDVNLPLENIAQLELAKSKQESVRSYLLGSPIFYKIRFLVQDPLPVVTSITLNDFKLCFESPATDNNVKKLILQHSLLTPELIISFGPKRISWTFKDRSQLSSTSTQPPSLTYQTNSINSQLQNSPSKTTSRPRPPKLHPNYATLPTSSSSTSRPISTSFSTTPTKQIIITNTNLKTKKKIVKPVKVIENYRYFEPRPDDFSCGLTSKLDTSLSWPWIVAIFFLDDNNELEFRCNGNLISRQHILTVARCLVEDDEEIFPDQLVILIGKLDLTNPNDDNSYLTVDVAYFRLHPDFQNLENADSDLAVIKLKEKVNFTSNIRSICLWLGDPDLDKVIDASDSFVAGWKQKDDLVTTRVMNVSIVSQKECHQRNNQFKEFTSNRTFCAANINYETEADFCKEAIGSGLVFLHPDYKRYHLRGIVSVFLPRKKKYFCDIEEYVVYVDIAKYLPWIKREILF